MPRQGTVLMPVESDMKEVTTNMTGPPQNI